MVAWGQPYAYLLALVMGSTSYLLLLLLLLLRMWHHRRRLLSSDTKLVQPIIVGRLSRCNPTQRVSLKHELAVWRMSRVCRHANAQSMVDSDWCSLSWLECSHEWLGHSAQTRL